MESAVTRILASSSSFPQALPLILKALCLGDRWDLGEVWILDAGTSQLRWGGAWHRSHLALPELEEASQDAATPVGQGLIGKAFSEGAPRWGAPGPIDAAPARAGPWTRAKMASVLALPFDGGEGTRGVLVLASQRPRPSTEEETELRMRILGQLTRLGGWKWGGEGRDAREAQAALLVGALPVAALVFDNEGNFVYASPAGRQLFAPALEQGATLDNFLETSGSVVAGSGAPYPKEKFPAVRALQGETSRITDLEVHAPERNVSLEVWGSPLRSSSGAVDGAIALFFDITESVQAKSDLERARNDAQAADRAKSDFVSRMSHEIRTPLNAILGTVDLLWETPLTQDQQQYLRICRNAGQNLMGLISNILDLSRVEAGKMDLSVSAFDLIPFLDKTVEIFSVRAHQKGVDMLYHVDPDVPTRLEGDEGRLGQVIVNLLGNAVKFTEKGSIILRVRRDTKDPATGALLFQVSDTGIGIPPSRHAAIFEGFTQATTATAAQYGGSGLGLTIAHHLVGMMEGKIWVESEPGRGSTFSFTIKLGVPPGTPELMGRAGLEGVRVLLIDEAPKDQVLLREILESKGASVQVLGSAKEGLKEYRRARTARQPFHAIVVSANLPENGGWDLVDEFRRSGFSRSSILLLPATPTPEDITKMSDAGVSNYLVKPADPLTLLAMVGTALREGKARALAARKGPSTAAPAGPDAPQLANLRLLIVEDTEDNRFLLQRYLRNTACRIEMAENGQVAVDKVKAGEVFDLILMDLQMPFMDGFEATRVIRDFEKENGAPATPIIALSAYAVKEEVEKSLAAGCNEHITKPVERAKLFEILARYGGEGATA